MNDLEMRLSMCVFVCVFCLCTAAFAFYINIINKTMH